MTPNIFDFILLVLIIACYFLSSLRGGSKQLFSLAAIIISFVIAGRHYWSVGNALPEKVFPVSFAGTVGFVVVFLLAFGIISLIGRFLDGIFKQLHFGGIDRFVSIIIGILKGFVLGCMTAVIFVVNYPANDSIVTDAIASPYIFPAVRKFAKLLPPKEEKEFFKKESDLKKMWDKREGKRR